ncbi:MAG: thiol:disulfide interchange protein DsbC [Thiomicrorhabdus sp.]|nr:MAG: thiol:disulfide interchange protein DsbC [Thiomicrorhabdus sp.]
MSIYAKLILATSVSSLLVFSSFSILAEDVIVDDTAEIKVQLAKMVDNTSDAVITSTPIPGLYQIQLGMTVVYMSKDGQYLLNGSLVELSTRDNLTEKSKAAIRKVMLSEIPVESMIEYPAEGEEKHVMTVFMDIDCAYCAKLHVEIPVLNKAGITVRYLSYPRAGFSSPSYDKAVTVWCSKDREAAMDKIMKGERLDSIKCANPVRAHMMQARRFEVNGTPNILLDSGEMLPGYVPAKELIRIFKQ